MARSWQHFRDEVDLAAHATRRAERPKLRPGPLALVLQPHFSAPYYHNWEGWFEKGYMHTGIFSRPDVRLVLDIAGSSGNVRASAASP